MPKLTLVVERTALKVYDVDQPVIRIGREMGLEVVVDNVAVSGHQAEIRLQDMQWYVLDLGSGNRTLLNGQPLAGMVPLTRGDEIAFGKFSLFFDHVPVNPAPEPYASRVEHGDPGRRTPAHVQGRHHTVEETLPVSLRAAEHGPRFYGRYELLSELGRGTSGVVYKAHDPKLDRLVAMKILRPELAALDESGVSLKQRFYQEAVTAGRLTHPAIVAVHDLGDAEGRPFMVMEYVEGGTLADRQLGGQPLPLADAVGIVVQVCAALHYAHRHGVVHRDIKPRNILVGPDITKVTDFGTARILGASHTLIGTMLGTPAYMSPEMVRGHAAGPRSDLFSLGVVLYEALTGVNPFNAADLAAVLYRIVNNDAPSVRRYNAALPVALDRVLRRALAKEPTERYATATDFADALREAATGERPTWTFHALREALWGLRRPWLLSRPVRMAASALCLLAVLAGTWTALEREPDVPRTAAPVSGVKREMRPAARSAPPNVTTSMALRRVAATPQEPRCLSVNALPFAEVYVDGRPAGYTPMACLRVPIGARRVHFQMDGQRSPARLLRITARHTRDAPLRLSYDFNTGRFIEQ
jgi:serine/threonine-protein kinase